MATVSTSVVTESGGTFLVFRDVVSLVTDSAIILSLLKSALETKLFQSLQDGTHVPETLVTSSPKMN